ncbi:MAG: hypothetical protein Q8J90_08155 [Gallionella sp.]|nr:hypothetical protein [Gallionella sp.]
MCAAVNQNNNNGAAERLVGLTLLDAWEVQERIRHDDGMSGSSRSACYRAVSPKGDFAFVKAFDFRRQELGGDTDALELMVREYNYEKKVHYFCLDKGVSRVTRIYGADKILIDGEAVHFLVCEWVDKCLREHQPPGDGGISASDRFTALRDAAAALAQLHQAGIAHQDIKPSNAMCSDVGFMKLTDLGSSSCERIESPPHDLDSFVGQPNYAPYELLYEHPPSGWRRRRFGCDLFLLGNLCFTSFVGGSLSFAALHNIPKQYRHTEFSGDYAEVMPHLIEAHELLIPHMLQSKVPEPLLDEVIQLVISLCHPDPLRRGHSKNLQFNNNQFGLERFITKFNTLATRAKVMHRASH